MLDLKLKRQSEHPIQMRREYEEGQSWLRSKLREEFLSGQHARWENRGEKVGLGRKIRERLEELRKEGRMRLEERKKELGMMLWQEHQDYKREIESMEESSEEVKQKMIERVKELKKKKEQERQMYVHEQKDRQFRLNCDELRKIEGQHKLERVVQERDVQMMEKQTKMMQDYEEELVYNELYKREILRKQREEERRVREQEQKKNERNMILDQQKTRMQDQRVADQYQRRNEQLMMKEEYEKDVQAGKERVRMRAELIQNENKNMLMFNEIQKEEKRREFEKEKEEDKQMVRDVIEREQKQDQLEARLREKERMETMLYMSQNMNKKGEEGQYEKEKQRLVDIENEKQWQKVVDKWRKEDEMRVRLMHEVYQSRKDNIDNKRSIEDQYQIEKMQDKEEVERKYKEWLLEEEEKKRKLWEQNRSHQTVILGQIDQKSDVRQTNMKQTMESERQERLQRLEYDRRIKEEEIKGRTILNQMKAQRPF